MALKKRIDYTKLPEADVVVSKVIERLNKGLNSNIFVIGLSGTGKSSTSLRLGELIQEKRKELEDIDQQVFVVCSLLEFVQSLRRANEGDILIIEEVSVLFPSKRAMARDNVDIGKILDTCRKRRLIIISNAPIWGSIDSHMRAMGHMLIETLRINKTQGVVVSKFHRLQTNPGSGKTYRHTMQRNGLDVARMFTFMPSKDRWKAYEEEKDKFMEELYSRIETSALKKKAKFEKELKQAKPRIQDLSARELQIHQLYNKEGLSQKECAERLGITQTRIHQILKRIIKKSQMD